MVIKLTKRDILDSKRYYIPIVISVIAFFVSLGFAINNLDNSQLSLIGNIVSGASFLGVAAFSFGLFILSIIANIYILYTSVYGDRGYDLFTMPVTSGQIIFSKFLTIAFWAIVSFAAGVVGFLLFLMITGMMGDFLAAIQLILMNLSYLFENIDLGILIVLALSFLVSGIYSAALILFSGAVANSSKFQKNRGVVAVLVYFGVSFVINVITSLTNIGWDFLTMMNISKNTLLTIINASMVFNIAIAGLLLLAVKWLWENKLEIL
ncbi:MAG TPA: ABC transporter permease [Erysipelothrix sp.]|nr:ABC transporter permease [Erysipelothrix sp.]